MTNDQRADRAYSLLLIYMQRADIPQTDKETAVQSLLTDLQHLSPQYAFTLADAFAAATRKEVNPEAPHTQEARLTVRFRAEVSTLYGAPELEAQLSAKLQPLLEPRAGSDDFDILNFEIIQTEEEAEIYGTNEPEND